MAERTIDTSGRIVLACSRCGEYVILLGLLEDWYRDSSDELKCGGCAKAVTLADRIIVDRSARL